MTSPLRQYYVAVDRVQYKKETLLDLLQVLGRRSTPIVICCSTRDSLDELVAAIAPMPLFHLSYLFSDQSEQERASILSSFRLQCSFADGTTLSPVPSEVLPSSFSAIESASETSHSPPASEGATQGWQREDRQDKAWLLMGTEVCFCPQWQQLLPQAQTSASGGLTAALQTMPPPAAAPAAPASVQPMGGGGGGGRAEPALGARILIHYDISTTRESYLRRVASCLGPSFASKLPSPSLPMDQLQAARGPISLSFLSGSEVQTLRFLEETCHTVFHEMPINTTDLL